MLLVHLAAWSIAATLYALRHEPSLVERRLHVGARAEREPAQKRIQLFTGIFVFALFFLPALDYGFGWSRVPVAVVVLGNALVALGFAIMVRALKENAFAAATVEVTADQRVIASGPYAVLRHPMYAGAVLFFLGVPLALGSWWGLLVLPPLIGGIAARLQDEERFLACNLPGYESYCLQVRSRLVPGVW